jgi:hypothetical protein
MTLTLRDLEPFCSTDPGRGILRAPWSEDGFTYGTNGCILVRVDRLPDVAEPEHPPDTAQIFELTTGQDVAPLPPLKLPAPQACACRRCDGRGTQHDCPACDCECVACEGTGITSWEYVSVGLRGALFAAHYIELILRLPGAAFSTTPPPAGPARFVFTGGEGALMPLSSRHGRHLEIAEGQ